MSQIPDPDEGAPRGRQTLAALIVVVVLALAGWWLASVLQRQNEVEKCLASGRHDCVPLETGK